MTEGPCKHPPPRGLEDELAIAEGARSAGEWRHAVHHYVSAFGLDVFSEQALAGVRRIHTEHDLLAELAEDHYVGAHAARAYLHADGGNVDDALCAMAEVDAAAPHLGAVRKVTEWAKRGPLSERGQNLCARLLGLATAVGLGRVHLLPGERAAVEPYALLALELWKTKDPKFAAIVSGMLRRAGQLELAREVAEAGEGRSEALVAQALAERAAGNAAAAVPIFEELHARTNELRYLLEKARALADAGRFDDALAALHASHPAGELDDESRAFEAWMRGARGGDAAWRSRDYDWVRRTALAHGAIVSMTDASTNALSDPRVRRGSKSRVGVSALEAPSARMCLAVHQGSGPSPCEVDYTFGSVMTPDPRIPRGAVETLLWVEQGGVMVQTRGAPAAAIREVVARVARESSTLFTAWDAAGPLAEGVRDHLDDLAACMVHPTDPSDDFPTVSWVYRTQIAAACLIARSDDGWRGTRRRKILIDLVRGPVDWTTAAAVLVLGEVAVRTADALPEVRRELMSLALTIPTGGHPCHATTLALVAHKVPFFPPDLREKLTADWLADGVPGPPRSHPAPSPQASPAEQAPAGEAVVPTKPWWKFW